MHAGAPQTIQDFIRKWRGHALSERSAAQSHFIDLCRVLGEPAPTDIDRIGDTYTFEKGVTKTSGGQGFADVWWKGKFAWEYKKTRRNLREALEQLVRYAAALEYPPLHVVCDTERFEVHTAWTNTVAKTYAFDLDDLRDPDKLAILKAVFADPERLKPTQTREGVTRDLARALGAVADNLRSRGHGPLDVAKFLNRLVFCFFAEDVRLLPRDHMSRLFRAATDHPREARQMLSDLFRAMTRGGIHGVERIAHFNGGLFADDAALDLSGTDVGILIDAARADWSAVDPTIFGTLFERILDPDKRAQIGAHYTDPEKIMQIIEPVILRPLRAEWDAALGAMRGKVGEAEKAGPRRARTLRADAENIRERFLQRLASLRVLDPACGSGNFLYLALQGLKDLEHRANLESEELELLRVLPRVGPQVVRGIEINRFAAELARTTIWIGDIQWNIRNGIFSRPEPILQPLDSIECRDALIGLTPSGEAIEAEWPDAEFIVGNPPFLGGKLLRTGSRTRNGVGSPGLGDEYVDTLFAIFDGRVPREADLVTYWFEKARAQIANGQAERAGLVSTNSIRGGANRKVLERLVADAPIFEAWSDEEWVIDGAAVRVSLICFSPHTEPLALDGSVVGRINVDLSAESTDLTRVFRLTENAGVAFMGDTKGGPFDIAGTVARSWLVEPQNANGRPNADVLAPWSNGLDVTRRPRDMWIIDFEKLSTEREASFYQSPYQFSLVSIAPFRTSIQARGYAKQWWRHERGRPEMRAAIRPLARYIATARVARHRLFVWMHKAILPDSQIIAVARDDHTCFGIVHSAFHEAWSLRLGTWLGAGNDPRYTPTTTFETFPFPGGLTPNVASTDYADDPRAIRIAVAAKALDDARIAWLNPPDLIEVVPEVWPTAEMLAAGHSKIYPDRILPKDEKTAEVLRKRTLTKLYNERPAWLNALHRDLDAAVAAAYGWPEDIAIDDALARLLALNLERHRAEQG